ncbi:MAG: hypothetical protein HYS81_01880 [Candidatus Aenigmatarchaeota archaeon]|nr:MAG: hypothetical protein HYS81_01880 [Candidatus Aenigmarchaeota archaeon]
MPIIRFESLEEFFAYIEEQGRKRGVVLMKEPPAAPAPKKEVERRGR